MTELLAQRDGGWEQLLYLLIIVVLPALSALGKKLRERFGSDENEEPTQTLQDERPSESAHPPPARSVPSRNTAPPAQERFRRQPIPPPPPKARPATEKVQPARRARPVVSTVLIEQARQAARTQAVRPARPAQKPPPQPKPKARRDSPPRREEQRAKPPRSSQEQEHAPAPHVIVTVPLSIQEMRRAVILSEVLAPPLALREDQSLAPGLD